MNVHVIAWLGFAAHQMVMNRSDIDTAFQQFAHNRIDFGLGKHEVTHDHRAILNRLEAKPATERQGRLDCNAVKRHLKSVRGMP